MRGENRDSTGRVSTKLFFCCFGVQWLCWSLICRWRVRIVWKDGKNENKIKRSTCVGKVSCHLTSLSLPSPPLSSSCPVIWSVPEACSRTASPIQRLRQMTRYNAGRCSTQGYMHADKHTDMHRVLCECLPWLNCWFALDVISSNSW